MYFLNGGVVMEPRELSYANLDYSDRKSIQGLLRFYYQFKSTLEYKPNFELISILSDLVNAIKHCRLTYRQAQVLRLYMKGYCEWEIGKKLNITQQATHKHIELICNKISYYLIGR